MEYPGSKLTKNIRRAIFIFYLVAFFVICPTVILYSSGYRYDWEYGLPRRTGAISIDVETSGASLYLNDIKQSKYKTGSEIRLKSVVPGKYTVKLTKDGYYDWIKDVEVKEMETVYVKQIILVKKELPIVLSNGVTEDMSISPDGRYLAFLRTVNGENKIWIRNNNNGQETAVIDWNKNGAVITWAESNHFFSVSDQEQPHNKLLLINAENTAQITDLTKKIKNPIIKYQWHNSSEPELYFSSSFKLMSYLPLQQRQNNLSDNNFLDWYMEDGSLWTISQDPKEISQLSIYNDTLGFKNKFNALDLNNPGEINKIQILTAHRGNVLLKDVFKSEMLLVTRNKKFTIAGEKFTISPYNNWWLIWSPWELWSYTEGEDPILLTRSGEYLNDVLPLDKYNALGLVWGKDSTVLYPYYLVTHAFVNYPITSEALDSKNRIFYFSAKVGQDDGLWSLQY